MKLPPKVEMAIKQLHEVIDLQAREITELKLQLENYKRLLKEL